MNEKKFYKILLKAFQEDYDLGCVLRGFKPVRKL